MSQIRRQKFKLHNNGLGRKTSFIVIIQKLKPYIYGRYASQLTGRIQESERDTMKSEIILKGAKHGVDGGRKADHIVSIMEPHSTNVWHGRIKAGTKKRLPIIQDVQDATFNSEDRKPKVDLEESAKKLEPSYPQQHTQATEQLGFAHPIRNYWSQLEACNLIDSMQKHFLRIENLMTVSKFVTVMPGPRFGHRVEIELENNARAIELISLHLYLFELEQELDLSVSMPSLEPNQLHQQMLDDFAGSGICDSFDCVPISQGNTLRVQCPLWGRKSGKLIKFILIYFVVFCIIGGLSALI
ncbi:hypothetical protein KR222_004724 [Zaprionus bogoriensis]|nr:hypothetical protein KR222_004724 [Zaprionus bogoriensis]